jgi:dTDP-4-amino-4,6-dideoxygalactose transaminase
VGLAQLEKAESRIEHVKRVFGCYRDRLVDMHDYRLISIDVSAGEIPLYVEILTPDRDRLVAYLSKRDIQTRPFYPDIDRAEYLTVDGDFPNARVFAEQGLILPCGPTQPLENVDKVLDALGEFTEVL